MVGTILLQETLGYITREHECINEENLLPVVKRWRISRINKGERGKKEKEKKKGERINGRINIS